MDAEDAQLIDAALNRQAQAILGLVYALAELLRELVEQGAISDVQMLERVRKNRMALYDAGSSELFSLGWAGLSQTLLENGKCNLPPDWLCKLALKDGPLLVKPSDFD